MKKRRKPVRRKSAPRSVLDILRKLPQRQGELTPEDQAKLTETVYEIFAPMRAWDANSQKRRKPHKPESHGPTWDAGWQERHQQEMLRLARQAARLESPTDKLLRKLLRQQTPARPPVKQRRKRPAAKFDRVLIILTEIDRRGELASDLQPAEIEKKVKPDWNKRWPKESMPTRSWINYVYQVFLLGKKTS